MPPAPAATADPQVTPTSIPSPVVAPVAQPKPIAVTQAKPQPISITSMPSPQMNQNIPTSQASQTFKTSDGSSITASTMQNAINQAKANPNTPFAKELMTRMQSGNYNDVLKSMGIDTSKFGPAPAPATPESGLQIAGDQIKNAAEGGAAQAEAGFGEAKNATNPVQLLEGSLRGAAGTINAVASPLAPIMAPIGSGIKAVSDAISDIPAVQRFANSKVGGVASRVAEDVADADTIAGAVAGPDTAEGTGNAVKNFVKGTPEEQAAASAAQEAAQRSNSAASAAKAKDAIDTEVRNTASKYPSVSKVLNRSEVTNKTDPVGVLSSYAKGEALPTLSKGKLQVDGATSFLKSQISKLSDIKNRLVATGKGTTSIDDFQERANAIIDSQKGWSLAKKSAAKTDVAKITNPWSDIYPDGIPNTELDSLKTEHTNESSSYNSKSPFNLDSHAVVGKAARQLVESNAKDAPIGELNKLIQSHYDAISLLNSMRGKTPHGGALSHMLNNTVGEVGGLAGGLAVGHPFIGAMVGRAGAEAINEIINNHFISNPLKRSIVNNMPNTDPAVVQSALDYLDANAPQEESTESAPEQKEESQE